MKSSTSAIRRIVSSLALAAFAASPLPSLAAGYAEVGAVALPPAAANGFLTGDFDADGDADVVFYNGSIDQYYRSNGDGSFTFFASTAGTPFEGLAEAPTYGANRTVTADFDGDGDIDILYYAVASHVYLRNDAGSYAVAANPFSGFTPGTNPNTNTTNGFNVGDFDADGDVDLVFWTGTADAYYGNTGGGNFVLVTDMAQTPFAGVMAPTYPPENTLVADFDTDGDVDVLIYAAGTHTYLRNDAGAYVAAASPFAAFTPGTNGLTNTTNQFGAGDFDSDGDVDLVFWTGAADACYRNEGSGTFTLVNDMAQTPFAGLTPPDFGLGATQFADFEGDGDLDVLFYHGQGATHRMLLQNGAPPSLASSSPADNATGVAASADIVLTFSEAVTAGAGNLEIVRSADDVAVETIAANGARVTGSGTTTITIDPAGDLAGNTSFYLRFAQNAFADADGAVFGTLSGLRRTAIASPAFLNFTTGAANTTPAFNDGATQTLAVVEGASATNIASLLDVVDADSGQTLTWSVASAPSKGALGGFATTAGTAGNATPIAPSGPTYTPATDQEGADSFVIQVSDGTATDSILVDVTIGAVNDAPSGADATVTVAEDAAHTFSAADFGFADADGSAFLSVKVATLPGAGTLTDDGVPVSAGDFVSKADLDLGRLVFAPAANAHGSGYASFTFQVRDDGGTANGGADLDPSANTLAIDVTAVNDAPSGADATFTVVEDAAHTFPAADFGFADADGSAFLSVKVTTSPGAGTLTNNGVAVGAGDFIARADLDLGRLVFTPAANAHGAGYASFTFQVRDDGGTANGGADLDPGANTLAIDVTAIADTPGVTGATTTQDTQTTSGLVVTRNAADGAEVTHFKVTAIAGGTLFLNDGVTAVASGGLVTVAQGGAGLKFTPAAGLTTAAGDTFSFAVQAATDAAGAGLSPPATASIAVAVAPQLTVPQTGQPGAGQVTLTLQSSETGTGYFTLLAGAGASAGSGAQTAAGLDRSNAPAVRFGSLPLVADTPATYTLGNLSAGTDYTVCFSADDGTTLQPVAATATFTTAAAADLAGKDWHAIGQPGFPGTASDFISMEMAPDGAPWVAYADAEASYRATVMRFDGNTWTIVGTANLSSGPAFDLDLAFAPDGSPHLAFADGANASAVTVLRFDGAAWVPVGSAGFSPPNSVYLSLAFSPDGSPHVAFRNGTGTARATVMRFNGSAWETVGAPDFTPGVADSPELAFGPDGLPYVAFMDATAAGRATVMRFNGLAWETVGGAGFSNGAVAPEMVFGADGTLYVAYPDGGAGNKVTVKSFDGTDWNVVGTEGFSAGVASFLALAAGPEGSLYVGYSNADEGWRANVMRFTGAAWEVVGTPGFSTGIAPVYSLAVAPDGVPHVAYADYSYGAGATVVKLATPPAVVAVHGPAAGTYVAGQNLDFTLEFSAPVNVSGTPVFAVAIGSDYRPVSHVAGSGTAELLFRYTVAAGDAGNLALLPIPTLELGGGTLQALDGVAAALALNNAGDLTGVVVDALAPAAPEIAGLNGGALGGTAEAGATVEVFADGVSIGTAVADGDGVWSLLLGEALEDGEYTFTVSATDAAGNTGSVSDGSPQTLDRVGPHVVSIVRHAPADYYTDAYPLIFRVTFSEAVTGATRSDFTVVAEGYSYLATLSEVSPSVYDAAVEAYDIGEYGLALHADATDIADLAGNALTAGFDAGERFFLLYAPDLEVPTGATVIAGTPMAIPFEISNLPETVEVLDAPSWVSLAWSMADETYAAGTIGGTPAETGTFTLTLRAANPIGEDTIEIMVDVQTAPTATAADKLHAFTSDESESGYLPYTGVREHDGWFYGTTLYGGENDEGVLYRLQIGEDGQESAFETLHSFGNDLGSEADGRQSYGNLIEHDGWLYGTARNGGGEDGNGVIYRFQPVEGGIDYRILHHFGGAAEARPYAGLTDTGDGWLYGTTSGTWDEVNDVDTNGCIYRMRPDGSGFEVLHAFANDEGAEPRSELLARDDGWLYGTAFEGGPDDLGTVFRFDPAHGVFEVLHAFDAGADETGEPMAGLTDGRDGWLYGTTAGQAGPATIFRIRPDGSAFETLKRFPFGYDNRPKSVPDAGGPGIQRRDPSTGIGALLPSTLLRGSDGLLYGVSYLGGTGAAGFVFGIVPDGSGYEVLAHLDPETTGGNPIGALIEGSDGRLYGTATDEESVRRDSVDAGSANASLGVRPAGYAPREGGSVFAVTRPTPAITSALTAEARQFEPFSYTITAAEAPATFSAESLPQGLSLDAASGVISGTPVVAGTFPVALAATRGLHTAGAVLTLTVRPAGPEVYFGSLGGDGGDLAAYVQRNGSGVLIGYLNGTGEGFIVRFTLDGDGNFTATVTPIPGLRDVAAAKAGASRPAIATTYTFSGRISGGILTGTIEELGLSFSAPVESPGGAAEGLAGYYAAAAVGTVDGEIHTVVGASGDVFVLALFDGSAQSGSGTVQPDGTIELELEQGGDLDASLDVTTGTIAGTVISGGVPQDFSGTEAETPAAEYLVNASARGHAGTGDDTVIAGFVVSGAQPREVLLRSVGPTLAGFGVGTPAADPRLRLFDGTGRMLESCDDWSGADVAAAFATTGAFALPEGSRDAALLVELAPGAYTLHADSADGTGVLLAEIYDAGSAENASALTNISVRGRVRSGENVLIGGFIVLGNSPQRMLVRAVGPALAGYGVGDPLLDPVLGLYAQTGELLASNDDWGTPAAVHDGQTPATAAQIAAAAEACRAFALGQDSADAAVVITLAPGIYTVHAANKGGSTGVALIEVYKLPEP